MKTRNGFVSNSSSSSFIVCFPNGKPKDVVELQRVLFGTDVGLANPYRYGNDPGVFAASDVARRVWDDLRKQRPKKAKDITIISKKMSEHHETNVKFKYEPPPEQDFEWVSDVKYDDKNPDAYRNHPQVILYEKKYKAWQKKYKAWQKKMASEFVMASGQGDYFQFEYEDHNGPMETAMEHGDLFYRLPHIRISNH